MITLFKDFFFDQGWLMKAWLGLGWLCVLIVGMSLLTSLWGMAVDPAGS